MKTQIIKIIPCLLAGFILSACVGAVTVPEGKGEPANPCIANPFGDSCDSADFNDARKAVCVGSNSERCIPIITRVCEADSLDALCADRETYYSAQRRACLGNNTDPRCELTITRVCDADSLDAVCNGLTAYFPMQRTICTDEINSDRCLPIIARICGMNAFDALCQLSNLTLDDLPAPSNSSFLKTSFNTPFGRCSRSDSSAGDAVTSCFVAIPLTINIIPLNNTNTGTATYAGSVSIQHIDNHDGAMCNQGRCRDNFFQALTENIDIIVDFRNSTLSYSGFVSSSDNPFNINGNFTDRGILTGKVNFRSAETPLYGLIGQVEAIGVFSNGHGFAGGFTATRQPAE